MKYAFCFILIVFVSVSMSAQKGLTIKNDLLEVCFNSTINKEDLEPIRIKLKEKGIELNYVETKYRKNGSLSFISFEVDFMDGFKGSASRSFLTKKTRFGFQRDYSENAKVPSRIGELDEAEE